METQPLVEKTTESKKDKGIKIHKLKSIKHTSNTSIIFSSFLHALILFTILSVLFIYVISVLEKNAFKTEINKNIDNTLPKALEMNDKNGQIKVMLQQLPLDKLSKIYQKPSESVVIYNYWLKTTMIICIIAGLIGIIISSLFLYFTCNRRIPFWYILLENIIIFTVVGLFEAYFFLTIAFKYVPVPPSLLINRLYEDLRTW
jgi:hypothetical protein